GQSTSAPSHLLLVPVNLDGKHAIAGRQSGELPSAKFGDSRSSGRFRAKRLFMPGANSVHGDRLGTRAARHAVNAGQPAGAYSGCTNPCSSANNVAPALVDTPALPYRRWMWWSHVLGEIPSRRATCLVARPRGRSPSTPLPRGKAPGGGFPAAAPAGARPAA